MSGIRNNKVFKQRSKVPATNRLFHIVQINALRNIEVMDRKLLTVEVKFASLWIAKVFTSKIIFVEVNVLLSKTSELIAHVTSKCRGFFQGKP